MGFTTYGHLDNLQRFCADWESVGSLQEFWVGGGGQYVNECASDKKNDLGSTIPSNIFFYHYAHSGKGMAHLPNTYIGYYQSRMFYGVKLIAPLKIGHRYAVSFFINLDDISRTAMNNIGVTFFSKKTSIIDTSNIHSVLYPNKAHVYSKNVIEDKINWVKIEGTFVADSAYTYMVVGNFFDHNQTTFKNLGGKGSTDLPIYLLDDFLVEEAKKTITANQKIICKGDSVSLIANGTSSEYFWSFNKKDTLSKADKITFLVDSSITAYLLSNFGIDSIEISAIDRPIKKIPTDTFLCSLYSIHIDGSAANAAYKWNTGDTLAKLTIQKAGVYVLETMTGTCNRYDTLTVTSCLPTLFVPNAFTPNGDEINNEFLPKGVQVYNYHLTIFNKWGAQIFESFDLNTGWDGSDQATDVYFYTISYSDVNNVKHYNKSGTISLLR